MLDMGFIHDVRRILAALPKKRQSLFFSATILPEIVNWQHNTSQSFQVAVTSESSTADIIQQSVYFVDKGNKNALLVDLLNHKNIKTALVFTRTKQVPIKL